MHIHIKHQYVEMWDQNICIECTYPPSIQPPCRIPNIALNNIQYKGCNQPAIDHYRSNLLLQGEADKFCICFAQAAILGGSAEILW